jgi:hypothetical protein
VGTDAVRRRARSCGFCSCRARTCKEDADACDCGPTINGPASRCNKPWTLCCLTKFDTATSCSCDDTALACTGNSKQVANCDVATIECGAAEVSIPACDDPSCPKGSCACPAGSSRCDGACTDVTNNKDHCGDCSTQCAGGAACVSGKCACAAGTVDCDPGAGLDCRDTSSDRDNCGSCGAACVTGAACASSLCDVEVAWVKLYGTAGASDSTPSAFR